MVVDNFVKNDAQLVGGRGISPAELDRITSEPDVSAKKCRERAVEARRRVNADEDDTAVTGTDNVEDVDIGNDGGDSEDEHLLSPDDSILVLTGANASGKSVFLKMVAIVVYMSHIGCFVPAETAVIGLTDRILTRVSTRESVSRNSSAFMIDLQQVSFMLRNCTERSLLIIDEFGKGTNASDGAGLFIGLLKHLLTLGPKLPKSLLATHFHEIFFSDNNFLHNGLPIGLAHMELIIDKKDFENSVTRDEDAVKKFERNQVVGKFEEMKRVTNVTPLFVLCPGLCLKSYAFHCAGSYGIGQPIIDRAMTVAQALSSFNMHEIMDPQMRPEDEKAIRESENVVRRLLQMSWDEVDENDIDSTSGRRRTIMSKLAECLGEPWTEPQGEVAAVHRH